MPDRERIIEALQYLISGECTDTQFDYLDEIEAAIALLKEQEAKMKHCNDITLEYAKEVFRLQTLLKEQQEIVRCKDCTYRGEINCPQYYRRDELSDDYFCADGERKEGR